MKLLIFILILGCLQSCNEVIPKPRPEPKEPPKEDTPVPVEEETPSDETVNEPEDQVETPLYPQVPFIKSNLIHQDTKEIVSVFVFYAQLFTVSVDYLNLIVEIDNTYNSSYAYCSRVNNNLNPKIIISSQRWYQLSDVYKEQLLFHELGHCLLNRSHEGDYIAPTSIMSSHLFNSQVYQDNYNFFVKELFNNSANQDELSYGEMYPYINYTDG